MTDKPLIDDKPMIDNFSESFSIVDNLNFTFSPNHLKFYEYDN